MGKYRMEEPWGYIEEKDYQSTMPSDVSIAGLFEKVEYNKSDNKMYFYDTYGTKCGTIDVSQFEEESIVVKAYYDTATQEIVIEFVNGDVVRVDVKEVLDENEFKDGLQVNGGQVSVLIDSAGEGYEGNPYLSTSENGVKISGIDKHIFDAVEAERLRATAEEQRIDAKLDQEIADRIADVDAEETRAKAEEAAANRRIDRLNDELDAEKTIREAADAALGIRITGEANRATSAETELNNAITAEINKRKTLAVHSAEYVKADKKIYFKNANNSTISEIDTTDFVVDGTVDDVKIENGNLVITFNTDSGKQDISIPLTDIFNPDNYYAKDEIDEKVSTINGNINNEATARAEGDNALQGEITVLSATVGNKANTSDVSAALDLKADKTEIPTDFYTKGEVDGKDNALQAAIDSNTEAISAESARAISAETDIETALSGKADADVVYTQEEVDALLAEKEAEYSRLKDMVLDLYYATTYSIPTDCTLDTMLKSNNGDAKLTEDITTGTIAAGVTAKNIVKLSLGGKTVTFTGNTTTNPAMMFRNKQQVNIGGSGTIDAGGRVAVWSSGADCEITLSGTMFGRPTYITDRSGGELIYCELGTINITDGIFKNTGDDKRYLLNCKDANYKAGTAKIIVTGGKFYDFNPGNNEAEGPGTSFLAEGYHTEASTVVEEGVEHTVYTVKAN